MFLDGFLGWSVGLFGLDWIGTHRLHFSEMAHSVHGAEALRDKFPKYTRLTRLDLMASVG